MIHLKERFHAALAFYEAVGAPDSEKLLIQKRREAAKSADNKLSIYLDTNHWVNLMNAQTGRSSALPVYQRMLELLFSLVAQRKAFCPVGSALFEELMKRSDLNKRRATAQLMDQLNSGLALCNWMDLALDEWRFYCSNYWKSSAKLVPNVLPWTKPGFWNFSSIPNFNERGVRKEFVKAAWIETKCLMTIEDATDFMGSSVDGSSFFKAFACRKAEQRKNQGQNPKNFVELLKEARTSYWLSVDNFGWRDIAFSIWVKSGSESEPLSAVYSFLEDKSIRTIPAISVMAGLESAGILSGRVFTENDMLDLMHLGSAIPYCSIVCCDRQMSNLAKSRYSNFEAIFPVKIFYNPEDIVSYLQLL